MRTLRQVARLSIVIVAMGIAVSLAPIPARAQDRDADIEALKREIEALRRSDADKERRLEDLQRRIDALPRQAPASQAPAGPPPGASESPLDRAVRELETTPAPAPPTAQQPETPPILSTRAGGTVLRLIDISLDGLFAAGGSTERDRSLQTLQGGGHDPRKRGFTVQNVELSLSGAVDPYLTGETHFIFFLDPLTEETVVELEEAFLTTQALPYGLQVKAGTFFTEFGLINATHPHQWRWQDQPIINTRLFGPDGMRGPGLRVAWLAPLPWFSELYIGVQSANGEIMASFLSSPEFFEKRPIGRRPFVERDVRGVEDLVYLARWVNAWNLTESGSAQVGFSSAFGPNATGPNGRTEIYAADLKVRWRPPDNFRGWPFFLWETEIMGRQYHADRFSDTSDPAAPVELPRVTLGDWGFYTQALYGFTYGWAAGLRYEFVTGSGQSIGGRQTDPFRDDRHRISPLVLWQPTEFSRFRLQYNYDRAEHLANTAAHSVWLGAEFLYGAHAAHKY